MVLFTPEIIYTITKFLDSDTKAKCSEVCATWNRNIYWTSDDFFRKLGWCSLKGYTDIVTGMLNHNRIHFSSHGFNSALNTASAHGHVGIVDELLRHHKNDLLIHRGRSFKGLALNLACRYGHLDVVKRLLHEPLIKLLARDLHKAIIGGHHEIIEWVLEQRIVELNQQILIKIIKRGTVPTLDRALIYSSKRGHAYDHLHMMTFAAYKGKLGMLNRLLMDRNAFRKGVLLTAIRYNRIHIVLRLLELQPPIKVKNKAIQKACRFGRCEILRYLLSDPEVDPTLDENLALYVAIENGHTHIVEILMEDDRIDCDRILNNNQ